MAVLPSHEPRALRVVTTYDYVVVGGGTAGCVVAARLAESGTHTVLLVEAGGSDDRFYVRLPIGYGNCFYDPDVNWMYRTEPEASLGGRDGYWPRGKLLGGSGSINAMVYVRGCAADYDDWAALGNAGWDHASVLPVFKRLERAMHGDPAWRGHDGPLTVTDISRDAHPLCREFIAAGEAIGLARNADFNGARFEGVGYFENSVRHGRRASSATAWLQPARTRANLHVVTRAQVTRVGFEGLRARSVSYRNRDGSMTTAQAAREVVLCAGAVNTPQLLLLSGVGPAAELRAQGIDVVADVPAVGRHLQDHLCIDYLYRSRVPTLNEVLRPWLGRLRAALRYAVDRRGPLAMSVNQAGGFVRSRPGLDRPNLQLYFSPLSYTRAQPGVRKLMSPDPFPGFLLSAQPCRPTSRGRIRLRSPDPFDRPVIEPNSLATGHDVDELVEGAQLLRRLAGAPPLASVIAEEMSPGPRVTTREDMVDDIRARASSVFHPVGTCRMGTDPRDAVVDARLRAHGLEGLRIVDASIFPTVTSGNTNTPVLMVAERGAQFIREDAA